VLLDLAPDRRRGLLRAVLFRGDHLHQLPPPGQPSLQEWGRLIGQRPHGGLHPLREQGQDLGVDAVRLRQAAQGLAKVSDLPGIDRGHPQPARGERGHRRQLVAAGGFQHDKLRGERGQPLRELGDARGIVRHLPAHPRGAHRDVQLRLGDINADECLGHCPSLVPLWPDLA
jgi:hypothetical protein